MDILTAHPVLLLAAVLIGGIVVLRLMAKLACLATLLLIGVVLAGVTALVMGGLG